MVLKIGDTGVFQVDKYYSTNKRHFPLYLNFFSKTWGKIKMFKPVINVRFFCFFFLIKANNYKMKWNGRGEVINIQLTARKLNDCTMPLNFLGIHIHFSLSLQVYFGRPKFEKLWLGHYTLRTLKPVCIKAIETNSYLTW